MATDVSHLSTYRRISGNQILVREDGTAAIVVRRRTGEVVNVLIDAADIDLVKPLTWSLTAKGYVESYVPQQLRERFGGYPKVLLHRLICGFDSIVVDHINHNTLDNRRCNLRSTTNSENLLNRRGAASHSRSQIRNVDYRDGHWRSCIKIRGKAHHLGTFDTEEAAKAAAEHALATRVIPKRKRGCVYFDSSRDRWTAQLDHSQLGRFGTRELAISALNSAVEVKYGYSPY